MKRHESGNFLSKLNVTPHKPQTLILLNENLRKIKEIQRKLCGDTRMTEARYLTATNVELGKVQLHWQL
ncbi:unnamed protein product, partial [Ceratitis capitata]